jgi:membrane peptidoglycan carboxypeptidase
MGWRNRALGIGLTVGLAGGSAAYIYERFESTRLPSESPDYQPISASYVCLADTVVINEVGELVEDSCDSTNALAIIRGEGDQTPVQSLDAVSPNFINALIATEDDPFYDDTNGINELAILPALLEGRGFSTLDMQLARNLFRDDVPKGKSAFDVVRRKDWELRIATKLNEAYTKDEILLKYINTVYFGRGANGVYTASLAMYDKTPDQLDLLEGATLAGLVRLPSKLDGSEDPAQDQVERLNMLNQRNHVLVRMRETGYLDELSQTDFEALKATGLDYVKPYDTFSAAGFYPTPLADILNARHYLDMFMAQVRDEGGYTENQLANNLKFVTSLRYDAQAYLNSAITDNDFPRDGREMAGVMLGPDGGVIAMVGGQNYLENQTNLTTQPQPGGSARKIWPYTTSFMSGTINLDTTLPEPPSSVWENANADGSNWETSGGRHCSNHDSCTVAEAIAVSSNPIIQQIMENQGLPALEQAYDLAEKFGAHSATPVVPSNILGSREVSLLDDVMAINGLIGHHGRVTPYHLLRGVYQYVDGKPIKKFAYIFQEGELLVEAEPVRMITEGMRGAARRTNGTAHRALGDFPADIALKTGTDDDNVASIMGVFYSSKLGGNVAFGASERFRDDATTDLGDGRTGGNGPAKVIAVAALPLVGEYGSI